MIGWKVPCPWNENHHALLSHSSHKYIICSVGDLGKSGSSPWCSWTVAPCTCFFFSVTKLLMTESEASGEHYLSLNAHTPESQQVWLEVGEDLMTFNKKIQIFHQVYRLLKTQENCNFQKDFLYKLLSTKQ
jgi:hypothetical protein